ncbi:Phosphate-regulating neutral endopeptidase [Strongyloides ratti]|uniref:Phosphate-regulating neutral endopeptidase n=1 Tax=Strongyloides ratti TaxID=34506 RepID=A0A090LH40_STRRB|nr:Phosphate-regulating neutral endopeptidase [Strongyloides ratti]CEF69097.1 Phosphate-regulating neutral endopeptidase [Strongyloides ratti]
MVEVKFFKILGFVLLTCISLATLIICIIILNNQNNDKNSNTSPPVINSNSSTTTKTIISTTVSPSYNNPVSNKSGFADAGKFLLQGIDTSVNPCEDFYQFSCGTYLKKIQIPEGRSRIGTYDEAQRKVNNFIAQNIKNLKQKKNPLIAEQITAHAYESCMLSASKNPTDKSNQILNLITSSGLGGVPFLNKNYQSPSKTNLWKSIGYFEGTLGIPTLFQSMVTVDYKKNSSNALYLNQLPLMLPRDFYIGKQYISQMNDYVNDLTELAINFNNDTKSGASVEDIKNGVIDAVKFEVLLAIASVPDSELRNYIQQYYEYSLNDLSSNYNGIDWSSYFLNLFKDTINVTGNFPLKDDRYIVSMPSYFGAVNTLFSTNNIDFKAVANFISLRVIQETSDFISINSQKIANRIKEKYSINIKKNRYIPILDEDDTNSQNCINTLMTYIPYSTGYLYVWYINNREDITSDIRIQTTLVVENFIGMMETLPWMSNYSLNNAKLKKDNLIKNVGWPEWYNETQKVEDYHKYYQNILNMDVNNYFDIYLEMIRIFQVVENFNLLNLKTDRHNFQASPATVNAWYSPWLNSITFPMAVFNPPYYSYDWPQAFNYAGQGGTAGHELTHGYDDEGVQFGPYGSLSDCRWNYCGWMDDNSTLGFNDMAQCVVSQFSEKCCPLKTGNVHCANGQTTQGENIADLGGQQAAYKAYRQWIKEYNNGKEEERLPGLENYTPNQIFWLTYGYSWCMKQETSNLVNQMLTNPHAPGMCRVNQVFQDIPDFGKDWNCPIGSNLYPKPEGRCKVWTGI